MKRIEVAVGVVYNQRGQVLVGQRVTKDQYFQKWEFPGGKLEKGESPEEALKREFLEETALELYESRELMIVEHDYPDRQVRLHVHTVHSYNGDATELEGQALKWVEVSELGTLDFLAGNQVILDRLKSL
jgi:8-oxo-dGTP diphosphatase